MKTLLILFIMLCFVYVAPAFAQNDTTGWGTNSAYNKLYSSNSAVEIKGEIIAVEHAAPISGMSDGTHLMINTGTDTISVHLGPKWYIDKQEIKFQIGDKVEVKGSKVMLDAKSVIIASEVVKEGQILNLRDMNGIPKWSGGN